MATTLFEQSVLDGWLDREAKPDFLKRQPIMRSIFQGNRVRYAVKGDDVQWRWRVTPRQLQSYGPFATFKAGQHADTVVFKLPFSAFVMVESLSGLELDREGTPGKLDDGTIARMENFVLSSMRTDWNFRLPNEIWNGALTTLNSDQGRTLSGITQSVRTNTSGNYAGQNRASLDGLRNQIIAATSGSSGNAAADAWQLLLRAKIQSTRARRPDGRAFSANLICTKEHIFEQINNKRFVQDTNPGATVNGVRSVMGLAIDDSSIDDDSPDNNLYVLSLGAFELATRARNNSELFKIRVDSNLPNHVHEDDKVIVMRSAEMQLIDTFPKAHVVIHSWS